MDYYFRVILTELNHVVDFIGRILSGPLFLVLAENKVKVAQ